MENNYKTIVYLTVNTENNKIYIGVHNTQNPYKFDGYIGNGVNVFHPYTIQHPSCPFHYAVKKYGFKKFKRFILKICDTREEALQLEKVIVNEDFIRREDTYNIVLGGGNPPSSDKPTHQYDLNGFYIKSYPNRISAEQAVGITSGISSAIMMKTVAAGFLWSDEKVDKLDLSEYKIVIQKKPIYAYDADGNFIKKYTSMYDFCKSHNVTLGPVQRAIIMQTKIAKMYVSDIKVDKYIKSVHKKRAIVPVYQYTLSGEYVGEYASATDAYKKLGRGYSQILNKIKLGKSICGDYQWSIEKLDYMSSQIKHNSAKKIGQYDLNGNLIKIYNTVRECRKDFGNVSRVLSGKCSQCKGYVFKYMNS